MTETSSSTPEVTYDVQEVIVGGQAPGDWRTSDAQEDDKDLKFLGHSGLEGMSVVVFINSIIRFILF